MTNQVGNRRTLKLESETTFIDIREILPSLLCRSPTICRFGWNKLILTGGLETDVCVLLDMSTKKWKVMKSMKHHRYRHASVCIRQQVYVFGYGTKTGNSEIWSTSVECLNIEEKDGEWQSVPPMPIARSPRITNRDTNVYLMGDGTPVLYLFDVLNKIWIQKTAMPQNPGRAFSIAAGNDKLYAAGGHIKLCWQYNISTDSWVNLSSPALRHYYAALIFHQNSLLLLGGDTEDIEGYSTERNTWVKAPFKLPEKLLCHHAFMMDLGV